MLEERQLGQMKLMELEELIRDSVRGKQISPPLSAQAPRPANAVNYIWGLFEKNTKHVVTITFSHIEP